MHALEKEVSTHSSILAWTIPGTVEPSRLPSVGLHRVGHNWSDLAAATDSMVWPAMEYSEHLSQSKPQKSIKARLDYQALHTDQYMCQPIGVVQSRPPLCNSWHIFFFFKYKRDMQSSKVEKAMATLSSTLAWKIPWTEGPGRLQSMGSLGVGHDWTTSLSLFSFMHWRRKWQPTPVFLPGESQGWGAW